MSSSLSYMHPDAKAAFDRACKNANMIPVVTQTEGDAPDSAGFHAADGSYKGVGGLHSYCAAVDFSVNQPARRISDGVHIIWDEKHIKWWLLCLANEGFAAWYRYQGSFAVHHIHAVFCGVRMKVQLRAQVHDFLNGRTGLVGHAKEQYWTADTRQDGNIKALFLQHNPE